MLGKIVDALELVEGILKPVSAFVWELVDAVFSVWVALDRHRQLLALLLFLLLAVGGITYLCFSLS